MSHPTDTQVHQLQFCPFEDVLGISTQDAFSSIIVPGQWVQGPCFQIIFFWGNVGGDPTFECISSKSFGKRLLWFLITNYFFCLANVCLVWLVDEVGRAGIFGTRKCGEAIE